MDFSNNIKKLQEIENKVEKVRFGVFILVSNCPVKLDEKTSCTCNY